MELESVTLSEISYPEKDRSHMFYSYVDPEKLNRRLWGRGRKKKRGRESNHKRPFKTEDKLRVDGGWEGGESG